MLSSLFDILSDIFNSFVQKGKNLSSPLVFLCLEINPQPFIPLEYIKFDVRLQFFQANNAQFHRF